MEKNEQVIREAAREAYGGMTAEEVVDSLPIEVAKEAAISQARILIEQAREAKDSYEEGAGSNKQTWEDLERKLKEAYDILLAIEEME